MQKSRIELHPVYLKRGCTSPHNQKNVFTSQDSRRAYVASNLKHGESIVDVVNKFKHFKDLMAASEPKVK